MRCDEIQDRFIELLYDETGTPSASPELRAHVRSCPACQMELEELKEVQGALREWKDEAPLRPVLLAKPAVRARAFKPRTWKVARFAAIAAAIVLAFLAGFAVRAFLPGSNYITKAETRDLLERALEDSESRMTETTNLKLQRVLETMENEQGYMYLRLTRNQADRNRNKN